MISKELQNKIVEIFNLSGAEILDVNYFEEESSNKLSEFFYITIKKPNIDILMEINDEVRKILPIEIVMGLSQVEDEEITVEFSHEPPQEVMVEDALSYAFSFDENGNIVNPPNFEKDDGVNVLDTHTIQWYEYDKNTVYIAIPTKVSLDDLRTKPFVNLNEGVTSGYVRNERGRFVMDPELYHIEIGRKQITIEDFLNNYLDKTKDNFVSTQFTDLLFSLASKGLVDLSEYHFVYLAGRSINGMDSRDKRGKYLIDTLKEKFEEARKNSRLMIFEALVDGLR